MGRVFQLALRLTKDRQALLDSQRIWLALRDSNCSAVADSAIWSCLSEMTKSRATVLAKTTTAITEIAPTNQIPSATATPSTSQGRTQAPLDTSVGTPIPMTTQAPRKDFSTAAPSETPDFPTWLLVVAFVLGGFIVLKISSAVRRKKRLVEKYGEEVAAMIIARKVWQGMTKEQLTESWGNPVDVGREIIRTKVKETWKYNQTGKNRFSDRIYLENGTVIGWKE